MFGNTTNKQFGQATAFGATNTFGAAPTSFGQNPSTGFGIKQTAPVFGGFGTTGTTAPGTMFNPTAAPGTTGLFGQTTGFGAAAAPTSTSSFAFGQPTTATSLFGSTAQPSTTMGLFGGSTASAFGTPRPSFGNTFTTTATPSLFGQPQPQQPQQPQPTASLFGQTTAAGGLFGASGFSNTTSGTVIKFNPPTGTDTMLKNGVSANISTRHQCITCMKEYENKSLEELRMEDYQANRKGAQAVGFGATVPGQGLFGSTPTSTSSFSFNPTQQNKSLFGGTTAGSFGAAAPSMFGQPNTSQATGLFTNKALTFGTTTTAPTPAGTTFGFGAPTNTATPLFGQANQPKPLFGQPNTTGLFGAPATSQPSGVFGAPSAFGGAFGQQAQPSAFMGIKSTFGATPATTSSSFAFGTPTSTAGGLFGNKLTAAATTFPSSTGFSTFSNPQTTGLGMFNQNKAATGFGATPAFGTTGGLQTNFGGLGNFGSTLNPTGGTSLFGNPAANAPKPGAFSFGNVGGTGFSSFGATPQNNSLSFGNTGGMNLGGMDPSGSIASQLEAQAQQQILALTKYPFGDSPLFRNLIKDTNKREEILKPTNPSAQRALMNSHKVESQPTNKLKPKSIQAYTTGKGCLFDGLEEEAASLSNDVFIPRKSVKKLTIKPRLESEERSRLESSMASSPGHFHLSQNMTPTSKDLSTNRLLLSEVSSSTDLQQRQSKPITHDESFLPKYTEEGLTSARNLTALENTISDLKPRGSKMFEVAQSISIDQLESDNEQLNDDKENSGETLDKHYPGAITLSRAGYYTIPALELLSTDQDGNCFVENFTIGRENYGNVFFPGITNLAGLNLDEIVHFRRKEVVVYLDDDIKPPVGEGLNKKAQVTLDSVWPIDKTTRIPIMSPEKIIATKFEDQLEKASVRLGAKFMEYRPETGSWVFVVQHF